MLARLTEIEQRRSGFGVALPGLGEDKIASLKLKLRAEKQEILEQFDSESPLKSAGVSIRKNFWLPAGIAAIALFSISILYFLKNNTEVTGRVIYARGDVRLLNRPSAIDDTFSARKPVITGKESLAIAKIHKVIRVLLMPESEILAARLDIVSGRPAIDFVQNSGSAFLSIDKGRADINLQTPAASIRVTGTQFSVTVENEETAVAVLEGEVMVKSKSKISTQRDENSVITGKKAIVSRKTGTIRISALSEQEVSALKLMQNFVASFDGPIVDNEIDRIAGSILAASQKPKVLTLADIKRKYGKISRVNLTDGTSYTGFFTMKADKLQIITPGGVVTKPSVLLREVRDAE